MQLEPVELNENDAELLDSLSDPYREEGYVKENKLLAKMESDLLTLDESISDQKEQLAAIEVLDVKTAKQAGNLQMKIEVAIKQSAKLRDNIVTQRSNVAEALRRAKMMYQREAQELWRTEFVPQIVDIYERLMELRTVYKYLKQRCVHVLNPSFPSGFDRAIGKNTTWLKRRKAEWLDG